MDKHKRITLDHGSGGRLSHELIQDLFFKEMGNEILLKADDSALLEKSPGRTAFTTDSFVITPLFFPGGDIGKLAVCGTVNDLAVTGAKPHYLAMAAVIEEGFLIDELRKIVISAANTAKEAGVQIVTGDTKVVEKGAADGLYITTSGIGFMPENLMLGSDQIKPGDAVIVSGTLGDHGIAVMSCREGLKFQTQLESDCAPLNGMLEELIAEIKGIRVMRDPTRGGLATTLNEFTSGAGFGILLNEDVVPVSGPVGGACELLGLDPLYAANEGKAVIVCDSGEADKAVAVLRRHRYGKNAAIVGRVTSDIQGKVLLKTRFGTTRMLDMLTGSQLPRIC